MKERPILFSAPMVRAVRDGMKTQTRRIVKPQPDFDTAREALGRHVDDSRATYDPLFRSIGLRDGAAIGFVQPNIACPYGKPGDRLWVRETWQTHCDKDGITPCDLPPDSHVQYPATYDGWVSKKRPSIHMPRWASRINLEITGVRVERLQDISEVDAQAEGCSLECMTPTGDDDGSAIYGPGGYIALWESINGAGTWDANPWVWALEFRRID